MSDRYAYRLPFGATYGGDGTHFRVWAPSADTLQLELDGTDHPMQAEGGGWHQATLPAAPGARYRFRLPDGMAVPDPASRCQAGDVHDPSLVVDPHAYQWRNSGWIGRPWNEIVVYELHAGAFGGFNGIRSHLPRLKALGVTAIELMPIADFPGTRNWGYDGVLPYAPDTSYGTPDELKALVDEAHGMGLNVMLDVVYNHFGPDGAYIHTLAKQFFREDRQNPWGASFDFRKPEVRNYFEKNALYWLMEYRFDGLRFDAVHEIDSGNFLDEMARNIRAGVEPGRQVHLVLEHEGNAASHLRAGPNAPGYDAQWTDDIHHCLHVLLTHDKEGYYQNFDDPLNQLARAMRDGFVFQGEIYPQKGEPRGEPSGHLPPTAFLICLQNHDQIGNRAMGERLTALADPQALRAATAFLLLIPFIPMLFMGEEVHSTAPFQFFTNHHDELADQVREGRREEFKHFTAFQDPERREHIPDPNKHATFERSIPDLSGDDSFHRTLLDLRARHVAPGIPGAQTAGAEALGKTALLARWRLGDGRLLSVAVNFGNDKPTTADPKGDMLFETPAGAWDSLMYGFVQERSCTAWIEAAS